MPRFEINAESLREKVVLIRWNPFRKSQASDSLFDGDVLSANDEKQTALICYLYGLKSYTDDIPYSAIVGILDPGAETISIENYKGPFIDLRIEEDSPLRLL